MLNLKMEHYSIYFIIYNFDFYCFSYLYQLRFDYIKKNSRKKQFINCKSHATINSVRKSMLVLLHFCLGPWDMNCPFGCLVLKPILYVAC